MHKATLTITLAATLLGAQLLSGLAQAASPIEGQLISNVTFDCRGTINYVVAPNSNNPAFVGHIQTIVDLPASAGGGSWMISGVLELGPDRGDNVNVKQRTAQIDRCFGRGDLQVGSCSTFSGVTRCQMQLDSTSFRLRIDRGSKGLFSTSAAGTELFSTSGMGTEFITFGEGEGL
jgi:hypothetical protein